MIKTLRTVYPEECTGIVDAGKAAMKYGGGVGGLYAGVLPTLVAMFPYVGVEFMVYETLKTRWAAYFGGQVSVAALLLIGAIAGAAAQASAHPLDVVRRRMQMEGFRQRFAKKSDDASGKKAPAKPPITNLVSGLYSIGKEEGIHCLFKGLGPACFEKVRAASFSPARQPRLAPPIRSPSLVCSLESVALSLGESCFNPFLASRVLAAWLPALAANTCASLATRESSTCAALLPMHFLLTLRSLRLLRSLRSLAQVPSTAIGYYIYEAMKTTMRVASV